MIGEEKYSSQDSLPDLITVNSEDFNFMWEDCMATGFGSAIPADLLRDEDPSVEESTSSVMQFAQIPIITAENLSDYEVVQDGIDVFSHAGPSHSVGGAPLASLVATNNWPGDYGFNVHFDELKQRPSKGANWIYSPKQDKLYVKKDVPCPIKFETSQLMTCDTNIRVFAVFDDSRYANDVVERCYNHCKQDKDKGIPFAEHVIKCECDQAHYEQDPVTKRLSVLVQFENPQNGEQYSTYIFKFTCLGSCSGGINRRPIKVIFILEHGEEIIGRRALDVRICACPRRDIGNDEKRLFNIKEEKPKVDDKNSRRKRPKSDDDEYSDVPFPSSPVSQLNKKARCSAAPPNGPYCVTTNDRKQYNFLKQMQKFYLMYDAFKAGPPPIKQLFLSNLAGLAESSTEEVRESDESDS